MLPLEVQISAMSQLRSSLVMMRDNVTTGDFKAIGGPLRQYGSFENSEMLSHHHALAHSLSLETLETVIKSIDRFYEGLVALQKELASTDEYLVDDAIRHYQALHDLTDSSRLPGLAETRRNWRERHGNEGGDGDGA